jgi:hypothetical protein
MRAMALNLKIRSKWLGIYSKIYELNEIDIQLQWLEIKAGYKPDQPRVPAGNADGGQWTGIGTDGTGSVQHTKTPRGAIIDRKIMKDMTKRNWTTKQIDDAIKHGHRINAQNMANGVDSTRYVNPNTKKSVVIENNTGKIIHVGDKEFKYSEDSGDKPGAVMRPAPKPAPSRGGGGGRGGGAIGNHPDRHHPYLFPWELLD